MSTFDKTGYSEMYIQEIFDSEVIFPGLQLDLENGLPLKKASIKKWDGTKSR